MRQYERVFLESKSLSEYARRFMKSELGLTCEGPRIVLSVEELREVWNRAIMELLASQCEEGPVINPDFETYLQSKGIKVKI